MLKRIAALILSLGCVSALAHSQLLSVTATLTDSDGTVWVNGSCSVTPYSSSGQPVQYNGVNVPLQPTCSINGSGVLSVSIYNTSTLAPANAQYRFTIQSQTSAPSSTFLTPVTSANLTSVLSALIAAPRFFTIFGAYGYADVEAMPTVLGSYYYQSTGTTSRQCVAITIGNPSICGTWQNFGGGGGGAVSSVFTRTGAVTAQSGDYSSFYCLLTGCTLTGAFQATSGTFTGPGGGVGASALGSEGTDPGTCAGAHDLLWASSIAHRYVTCPNGATYSSPMSYTVASGVTNTGTPTITSLACTTITASESNVLSSDNVFWSFNGSPSAVTGYAPATAGGISVAAYTGSGTVNFDLCNWSSGSITAGAVGFNWSVIR